MIASIMFSPDFGCSFPSPRSFLPLEPLLINKPSNKGIKAELGGFNKHFKKWFLNFGRTFSSLEIDLDFSLVLYLLRCKLANNFENLKAVFHNITMKMIIEMFVNHSNLFRNFPYFRYPWLKLLFSASIIVPRPCPLSMLSKIRLSSQLL